MVWAINRLIDILKGLICCIVWISLVNSSYFHDVWVILQSAQTNQWPLNLHHSISSCTNYFIRVYIKKSNYLSGRLLLRYFLLLFSPWTLGHKRLMWNTISRFHHIFYIYPSVASRTPDLLIVGTPHYHLGHGFYHILVI